jgi:transposase
MGVAKAAKQLGLYKSQLYAWRKQSEQAKTVSERESSLAAENARLKRQLWKTASKFCQFYKKEHVSFPAAIHYHVDIITHIYFLS